MNSHAAEPGFFVSSTPWAWFHSRVSETLTNCRCSTHHNEIIWFHFPRTPWVEHSMTVWSPADLQTSLKSVSEKSYCYHIDDWQYSFHFKFLPTINPINRNFDCQSTWNPTQLFKLNTNKTTTYQGRKLDLFVFFMNRITFLCPRLKCLVCSQQFRIPP